MRGHRQRHRHHGGERAPSARAAELGPIQRRMGRQVAGGILIGHSGLYDPVTRVVFGSLFRSIAADVALAAAPRSRVLEVGCGPGHLAIRLVRDHDLDVTAVDLDPAMIEHAESNAKRSGALRQPAFMVGDAAALPGGDASVDLVVSTLSMHHWSDSAAGLREIARVLRPGGRALIWDIKPGSRLLHARAPDPTATFEASPLHVVSTKPWRWPWRFTVLQRVEVSRP